MNWLPPASSRSTLVSRADLFDEVQAELPLGRILDKLVLLVGQPGEEGGAGENRSRRLQA